MTKDEIHAFIFKSVLLAVQRFTESEKSWRFLWSVSRLKDCVWLSGILNKGKLEYMHTKTKFYSIDFVIFIYAYLLGSENKCQMFSLQWKRTTKIFWSAICDSIMYVRHHCHIVSIRTRGLWLIYTPYHVIPEEVDLRANHRMHLLKTYNHEKASERSAM